MVDTTGSELPRNVFVRGKTKITNMNSVVLVQEAVLGLEIPKKDAFGVSLFYPIKHLEEC